MGRTYNHPPITEALCEFSFVPGQLWDLTIPGLMYEKVGKEFPDRKQKIGLGFRVVSTEKGFEQKVEPAPPHMQFHKADKTALIQVAPDLLVYNQLKPYPTWNIFKPSILKILETYKEVANPKEFKQIELRYINKIEIDDKNFKISDYFDFYPHIPHGINRNPSSYISRVEIPFADNRDLLLIVLGNTPDEGTDLKIIMLDIHYIMNVSGALPVGKIDEWMETAHSTIEESFESCIKEKSRELFGEVR